VQHLLHLQGLSVKPAVSDMIELEHNIGIDSALAGVRETASAELVCSWAFEPGVLGLLRHIANVTSQMRKHGRFCRE
jgi:hypothetical protein